MKTSATLLVAAIGALVGAATARAATDPRQDCIDCHESATPHLFTQWKKSLHAANSIGCYRCHQAQRSDPDHMEHNGTLISVLVTPNDCKACHMTVVEEFASSKHWCTADRVTKGVGPLVADFILGDSALEGSVLGNSVLENGGGAPSPAAVSGCFKCHGADKVIVGDGGQLEFPTWPSTGVGRVNPDDSRGRCATCHSAHEFSGAEARRPESCELCHGGSTAYNVAESYRSSLHGTVDAGGTDAGAPTCADCHMSLVQTDGKRALTHDVGASIGTLACGDDCEVDQKRRENMKKVCETCHVGTLVDNFFDQYQAEEGLIRKKWQEPAKELYCQALAAIKKAAGQDYVANTYPINYLYLRYTNAVEQAKRGAAMGSPRYTDQNNLYLAELFYGELVPELREVFNGRLPKPGETPIDKLLANPSYGPGWPHGEFESCDDETNVPCKNERGTTCVCEAP